MESELVAAARVSSWVYSESFPMRESVRHPRVVTPSVRSCTLDLLAVNVIARTTILLRFGPVSPLSNTAVESTGLRFGTVVKAIFLTAVALVILGCLAIAGMLFLWDREMTGKWPGKPLQQFGRELSLSNGGTIAVHSKESRSWGSTDFQSQIRYRPPGTDDWEAVGGWYGSSKNPVVKNFGDNLILMSPDLQTVYIRPSRGPWWRFSLSFLQETNPTRLAEQSEQIGIPGEDILQIRQSVDAEEGRWTPSVQTKEFDNESGVLTVVYHTNRSRIISFQLDPEGTRFRFLGIRSGP